MAAPTGYTPSKKTQLAVIVLVVGMFGLYLAAKITKLHHLQYQSDLFSHLQIARGWLQGKPFFYENAYGPHNKIHNYFFDLLMGPFALWGGSAGIFVFEAGLYLLAFFYSFNYLKKRDQSPYLLNTVFFYLVFFCGPLAFYVFDNPHYGFHAELLYLPLGLLFATALLKGSRTAILLSAIAMVLVKEDGAVLAACIHLLYAVWGWQRGQKTTAQAIKYALPRLALWLVVFAAGVWWLGYQNRGAESRLDIALTALAQQPNSELTTYFGYIVPRFLWLLTCFVLGLLWYRNLKIIGPALALFIPIVIVNLISGFTYFPSAYFSLSWMPRFALEMAYFMAAMLFVIAGNPAPWVAPTRKRIWTTVGAGIFLLIWQLQQVKIQAGFHWQKESVDALFKKEAFETRPYYDDLKKLRDLLSEGYPIALPPETFAWFEKQDFVWTNALHNAYTPPDIVIYTAGTLEEKQLYPYLLAPMQQLVTPGGLTVYYKKEAVPYLQQAGWLAE